MSRAPLKLYNEAVPTQILVKYDVMLPGWKVICIMKETPKYRFFVIERWTNQNFKESSQEMIGYCAEITGRELKASKAILETLEYFDSFSKLSCYASLAGNSWS